jgi:serine/threonine-protein kinase HipA
METIIADLLQEMDGIIEQTAGGLPSDFPDDIARSVFDGMKQARDRLIRLRN